MDEGGRAPRGHLFSPFWSLWFSVMVCYKKKFLCWGSRAILSFFWFYLFFCIFLIKKNSCVQARMWSSEDNPQGLVLSCYLVRFRNQTQVIRPTHKHLYLELPHRPFLEYFYYMQCMLHRSNLLILIISLCGQVVWSVESLTFRVLLPLAHRRQAISVTFPLNPVIWWTVWLAYKKSFASLSRVLPLAMIGFSFSAV